MSKSIKPDPCHDLVGRKPDGKRVGALRDKIEPPASILPPTPQTVGHVSWSPDFVAPKPLVTSIGGIEFTLDPNYPDSTTIRIVPKPKPDTLDSFRV